MSRTDLDRVLHEMLASSGNISDLNFSVGRPPQVEVDGELRPFEKLGPLTPERTERIARMIVGDDPELLATLERAGSCDCAYQVEGGPRFRANVFTTSGARAIVLRALPAEIPTLEGLGLPEVLGQVPELQNGLVLITGGTGSGKSTTLAAVIDAINRSRAVHVVTLEDPVEFRHPHRRATVNQRELGRDFASFAEGLRAALRQAPKVILVGEMRDRETVEIALKAAETGHLVLSTLHTIDAGQTIGRIVGMFDGAEENLVRGRLAQSLRFVVSQRLLPRQGSGRVAAVEVMGSDMRVRELMLNGETADRTFRAAIASGRSFGWQSFDQHIAEIAELDQITPEVALAYASDRAEVKRQLDRIRSARGHATSDLGDLQMDHLRRIVR